MAYVHSIFRERSGRCYATISLDFVSQRYRIEAGTGENRTVTHQNRLRATAPG
jgi:hypothetical protein